MAVIYAVATLPGTQRQGSPNPAAFLVAKLRNGQEPPVVEKGEGDRRRCLGEGTAWEGMSITEGKPRLLHRLRRRRRPRYRQGLDGSNTPTRQNHAIVTRASRSATTAALSCSSAE